MDGRVVTMSIEFQKYANYKQEIPALLHLYNYTRRSHTVHILARGGNFKQTKLSLFAPHGHPDSLRGFLFCFVLSHAHSNMLHGLDT